MCVPQNGHEAEFAGFYAYCTIILAWFPPLIFSLLVEAGLDQKYGVIAVSGFFTIALIMLSMAAPWEEILEETRNASVVDADNKKTQSADEFISTSDSGSVDE